jgi:hypothetical protein
LGGGGVEEVEKFSIVLVLIVSLIEGDLGDVFEEAGHEDAGAFLGLPAQAAVALAEGDEGVAGLGYLHEGPDELGLAARVATMLEGVEIASGSAGTRAAAAPVGMATLPIGNWRLLRLFGLVC